MTTADGGWQPGATVLGEFVVEHELGDGGYWRVAMVRDWRGEPYTVKRVVVGDLVAQQRFLTEVQRWIGLPPHPHLATCRFVRTLGDELLVFSEYVLGGSLADWIRDGRLYTADGDPTHTILRIAIESAWGLDAAHAMGLPHLDVKPANVLLTDDGAAKVTDFGAAREPEHLRHLEVDGSIRPAPEGAYAAPEQAEDQPVDHGADAWSWAVTVLEMFAGERTWHSGALADAVLEQLVTDERWRVAMPAAVVDLLRTCLRFDPARRPRSLGDVADALTDIASGLGLPERPRPARPSVLDTAPNSRGWSDPRGWLSLAYSAAGQDPREATVFWPSGHGTHPQEDLRAFAVARRVLDEADGPVIARARLRAEAARVALHAGDRAAGIAHLRGCIELLEDIDDKDSRPLLATALTDLAVASRDGELPIAVHDRAIAVAEETGTHPEVLGAALLAKADTLGDLDLYDRALGAFERAADLPGAAAAITAMARALHAAGNRDQAERLLADLHPDDDIVAGRVAIARAELAGSAPARLTHAQAAVDLFTPLVRERGRHELAGDLGRAWFLVGLAHESLGRPRPALVAYRAARTMLAAAVVREGHGELATELATAYDHEATLKRDHENPRAGAEVAGRAVELWQRLTDLDGPGGGWTEELATARERLGTALMEAGDTEGAREQFDEVLRLVPESEIGTSARRRTLAAMAHRQHGVLLRRGGDPVGACGRYQHALYLLADADEPGFTRVLVLESLSAALGDAGHLDESVQVLQQSTEELAQLVRRGLRGEPDLADSHRRLANALLELGDFRSAADAATAGLARYARLIIGGRDDLVERAARLRASYGYLRHRLSDVDGAIDAIGAARKALTSDAVVAQGLEVELAYLRGVAALRPDDLDEWFDAQREALASASRLTRAGRTREASRQVEEIVGSLGWLVRRWPTEQGYALCGQAGVDLGMSAMHAKRNGAAHHGFVMAVDSYGVLVDNGLRQYVDDWARAYVGLASLLTVLGDDDGADGVVTELLANLGDVDRAVLPAWRDRAVRVVSEMRATRS